MARQDPDLPPAYTPSMPCSQLLSTAFNNDYNHLVTSQHINHIMFIKQATLNHAKYASVAVVGGGIGGLTAANALLNKNPNLIERLTCTSRQKSSLLQLERGLASAQMVRSASVRSVFMGIKSSSYRSTL